MDQPELLQRVADVLESLRIPYMVVGSIASMAYGEPRFTQDIDFVVALREDQVQALCSRFPQPAYYVSVEAARQAAAAGGQFNIIHPTSGNKVDLVISRDEPWYKSQLSRRRRIRVMPDIDAYMASPEDVILAKLQSYREGGSDKHLRDITGILRTRLVSLDRAYLEKWARSLGVLDIWMTILDRLETGA